MPETPPLPKGLRGAGAVMWAAYWADPVSCAASGVDGYDIGRYCLLLSQREGEERKAKREGVTIEGMNGPILNPRYRVIKEITREIEKLREMLGVTPLARMRLGLVQTQRDIGVADLRRRLDRSDEARGVIEAEATEVADVDLDQLG